MLPVAAAVVTTSAALKVVPTLKETSLAVYALVSNFYAANDLGIAARLKHLDLDARARVIEALVLDLDVESTQCASVRVARDCLRETMAELRVALESLHACTRMYKRVYFATWRYGAQLESELQRVSRLSHVLRKRTFLLVQILPLAKRQ